MNIKTETCKICYKEIKTPSIRYFAHRNIHICNDCLNNLKPKFIKFKVNKYSAYSIYEYDEQIKSLLYQFKGCFDIELSPIFLYRFKNILKLMFYQYLIVPIPSDKIADERREFNHVIEMFKCLNLPILKIIEKIDSYKQSDQLKEDRNNIIKHLKLSHIEKIRNKRILLVDDVFTTGNTISAATRLLEEGSPKDIKILVMAKVSSFQK